MPKVSEQHTESRRRQIIDAAYRCFAQKGLHQTTMRDIYEIANLSPGAVYHYFESKDEIIQASFDFDYERSAGLFEDATRSDDPLAALQSLLGYFLHGLEGAAALGAGSVNVQGWSEALVNPRVGQTLRRVMGDYLEALWPLVRRAQDAGQLDRSLDPVSVSRLLLSIYYGLELQMALDPNVDVDGYLAAATMLIRSAPREG